ncbi:MAG: type II toxin-antitoxin system RelE/ParE family toxin [Bacteroidales bacterium]|nr:type II toxin-antitoxin system RelE/ParE family toxin [Bacteroidales bacterium]
MKRKFRLSNRAKKDLAGIWRYTLENWSRDQANSYVGHLMSACASLADSSRIKGRFSGHIREGYLRCNWGHHVIFFKIESDDTIFIVRILHEKMDYDRHL